MNDQNVLAPFSLPSRSLPARKDLWQVVNKDPLAAIADRREHPER